MIRDISSFASDGQALVVSALHITNSAIKGVEPRKVLKHVK